jgi:acyl dehydratase
VADVIDVRRSEKRPTLGILRWRWRLINQREQEVLDLEATSLFKLEA